MKLHDYLTFAALTLVISGCALMPNSIRPEAEHMSHLTQHQPLASEPHHYGLEMVDVVAHWDLPHAYIEAGEGLDLDSRWCAGPNAGYGEVLGPREQFLLRVGYVFDLKGAK